jgi:hypothetical protein
MCTGRLECTSWRVCVECHELAQELGFRRCLRAGQLSEASARARQAAAATVSVG